jgi:membrane protein DedA with SNARE-associated domain
MLDDPLAFMSAHPGLVVLLVCGGAFLEHVFPPFWGDTVMLIGAFLAGLGRVDGPSVFAAAFLGSCLGASAAYGMGHKYGRSCLRMLGRGGRVERLLATAEAWYERHGSKVLAVNRFLPGVRGVFLPLAGITGMPFRQVLLWSSTSNALYCGLLLGVGAFVGANNEDFTVMKGGFQQASLIGGGIAVMLLIGVTLLRRKPARD